MCRVYKLAPYTGGAWEWRMAQAYTPYVNFFTMPDYRRLRIPGGCYFFTVNLLDRNNDLLVEHIDLLRGVGSSY